MYVCIHQSLYVYMYVTYPQLLVMGSKQKPKRLTMHGDDERDYMVLAKGGDDLRLDQRIEQLFEAINEMLDQTAGSSKGASLSDADSGGAWSRSTGMGRIRTFQVVPMEAQVGVLEWVDGTVPFKSVIEDEAGQQIGDSLASKRMAEWLHKSVRGGWVATGGKQGHEAVWEAVFKKEKKEVVPAFTEICKHFPRHLMKQSLWRRSASPDAFFSLRNAFASSLGAFNAVAYVLGVGDRHPDNFLIQTTTAEVCINKSICLSFFHYTPLSMPYRWWESTSATPLA
jgi:DNA-dependent protein kinase catalytic subunit